MLAFAGETSEKQQQLQDTACLLQAGMQESSLPAEGRIKV